ncbi:MAG: hypothetical protein NTW87_21540, partial [Planctomycetota bacterium]|nr:hypothetical protein [Planctomycetota bacterium]
LIFMTFYGEPRDKQVYEHAHEAPLVATVPLLILATLCLGFWWSGHLLGGNLIALPGVEHGWINSLIVSPVPHEVDERLLERAHGIATIVSLAMLALGFGTAYGMCLKRKVTPEQLLRIAPLRGAYTLFSELWFIDRLYQDGIVVLAKKLNRQAWRFDDGVIDRWLVDGWSLVVRTWSWGARVFDDSIVDKIVDLFGVVTWLLGVLARALQAGKIQYYVCVTFGIVVLLWLGLLLW